MHHHPRLPTISDADHLHNVKTEAMRSMSEPDISRDIPSGGITSFPEDSWVEVRYPLTGEQEHGDRAAWPWLPGWVVSRCGPDEWELCVQTPELVMEHEGETVFPVCFRDSSELRTSVAEPEAGS